jgi:hypothetical protein
VDGVSSIGPVDGVSTLKAMREEMSKLPAKSFNPAALSANTLPTVIAKLKGKKQSKPKSSSSPKEPNRSGGSSTSSSSSSSSNGGAGGSGGGGGAKRRRNPTQPNSKRPALTMTEGNGSANNHSNTLTPAHSSSSSSSSIGYTSGHSSNTNSPNSFHENEFVSPKPSKRGKVHRPHGSSPLSFGLSAARSKSFDYPGDD